MTVKRVVVRLSPEEKQMLRELAEFENTSMTEVVKRIIDDEYDARFGQVKKGSSGAVDHQEVNDD